MSQLTDFKLLSFDVYGTLIDWESGAITALEPLLQKSNKAGLDRKRILQILHQIESAAEKEHPAMKYADVLKLVHPKLCQELGLVAPSQEESERFGESVGEWPAFPDTVEALKRLSKVYKLVVLSNVDNESFQKGNADGLRGFHFDAVYTAQDIGSYKPSLRNFEYMFKHVKEEFGIDREKILQTAQSQYHDHHPAKDMGMKTCWIYRPGAIMGNRDDPVFDWKFDTLVCTTTKHKRRKNTILTLIQAELADAVEKELSEKGR